jgi:hypothetical protein
MAGLDRFRRFVDLEVDPLAVSAAETQRIVRRQRQERERRLPQGGSGSARVSLSAGWDRRRRRPIPG